MTVISRLIQIYKEAYPNDFGAFCPDRSLEDPKEMAAFGNLVRGYRIPLGVSTADLGFMEAFSQSEPVKADLESYRAISEEIRKVEVLPGDSLHYKEYLREANIRLGISEGVDVRVDAETSNLTKR